MSELHPQAIAPVWIASYPRSGNTFLRIILQNIFHQPTYSIYRIGGQNLPDPSADALENAPHLPPDWAQSLTNDPSATRLLIKTHGGPANEAPAIYIARDGRAAVHSYYHYHQKFSFEQPSLTEVIAGACQFGGWSGHYSAWQPRKRARTLFVRYEEIIARPAETIRQLADFLQLEPVDGKLPTFAELKAKFPAFFRRGENKDFLAEWTPAQLALFNECHGAVMQELGYAITPNNGCAAELIPELVRSAARSHYAYIEQLTALGVASRSQARLREEVSRLSGEVASLSTQLSQRDSVLLPLVRNPWVKLGKTLRVVPNMRYRNGEEKPKDQSNGSR